jgi:hypothetical protein
MKWCMFLISALHGDLSPFALCIGVSVDEWSSSDASELHWYSTQSCKSGKGIILSVIYIQESCSLQVQNSRWENWQVEGRNCTFIGLSHSHRDRNCKGCVICVSEFLGSLDLENFVSSIRHLGLKKGSLRTMFKSFSFNNSYSKVMFSYSLPLCSLYNSTSFSLMVCT